MGDRGLASRRGQVGAVWKLGEHCEYLGSGTRETKERGGLRVNEGCS